MLQTLSLKTDTHILKDSILNPVLLLSCIWTACRITPAEERFLTGFWRPGNALDVSCFARGILRAPEPAGPGQARCQTALSRQAPGQERRWARGTGRMSRMVSCTQAMQASAHVTGTFRISSWKPFLCAGFSAKMTKPSLSHCLCIAPELCCLFVLALCRIWDWIV